MSRFLSALIGEAMFWWAWFCLPQWCEQNDQCRRLHLPELLVAPLHRLTRYPLLLKNIWKRSTDSTEKIMIYAIKEKVEKSIRKSLKWGTQSPVSALVKELGGPGVPGNQLGFQPRRWFHWAEVTGSGNVDLTLSLQCKSNTLKTMGSTHILASPVRTLNS